MRTRPKATWTSYPHGRPMPRPDRSGRPRPYTRPSTSPPWRSRSLVVKTVTAPRCGIMPAFWRLRSTPGVERKVCCMRCRRIGGPPSSGLRCLPILKQRGVADVLGLPASQRPSRPSGPRLGADLGWSTSCASACASRPRRAPRHGRRARANPSAGAEPTATTSTIRRWRSGAARSRHRRRRRRWCSGGLLR